MTGAENVREMHDRLRLREALADAISAAQEARAPDRVLGLLRGAYRTLESAHFVDDDMIRWAEASLGAWRRWLAAQRRGAYRILVVDDGALEQTVKALAAEGALGTVRVARSHSAALEALATDTPDVVLFDCDATVAPTAELLEWLATDLPQLLRIGYAHDPNGVGVRERQRFDVLLPKPATLPSLRAALDVREPRFSTG